MKQKIKELLLWGLVGGIIAGALRLAVLVVKYPAVAVTFLCIAAVWVAISWAGLWVLNEVVGLLEAWAADRAKRRRTTWRRA